MNTHQQGLSLAILLSAALILPTTAKAEDIEIYFNPPNKSTPPSNVLFILDNSGSMYRRPSINEPYEPGRKYGTDSNKLYVYDNSLNYLGIEIPASQNNCQAMKDYFLKFPEEPVYKSKKVLYWDNNATNPSNWQWSNLCIGDGCNLTTSQMDCQEDSGQHGDGGSNPSHYMTNANNGPYTMNPAREVIWGRYAETTIMPSDYHHWYQGIDVDIIPIADRPNRMDTMVDAVKSLVDDFDNLNFGMMKFNARNGKITADNGVISDDYAGGYVFSEFIDISTAKNKKLIKDQLDTLRPETSTPLSETLYEASLVFRGLPIDQGESTIKAAKNGNNYISPMTHACQKNHIVYLTDGEPYHDGNKNSNIRALRPDPLEVTSMCERDIQGNILLEPETAIRREANETCLDEMAAWLYNTDLNSALPGTQNVYTHVVALGLDLPLLTETAKKGGPNASNQYYRADNARQLKAAFEKILRGITESADTFAAPAVAVEAFSRLYHREELYFALFEPQSTQRWNGNIKRYKITSEGIFDVNNNMAIDSNGYFKESGTRSWWSPSDDNDDITAGGMAANMPLPRTLYTYTGTHPNLTHNNNDFNPNNNLLSLSMLGAFNSDERIELIAWALGHDIEDVNDSTDAGKAHRYIPDILHNAAVAVTYSAVTQPASGNTPETTDYTDYVFAGTNMGSLHAVDASTGEEVFAFIPPQLLGNIKVYKDNNNFVGDKPYGLDGAITVWQRESGKGDDNDLDNDENVDLDSNIESADGDHVYLYVGMRRGGNAYYALDVTDINAPKLLWSIDYNSSGFADLGQSWSKPKLANISDCSSSPCKPLKVLFFSGGYDLVNDSASAAGSDDAGNAIYMVDARTGNLLWSAGDNSSNNLTLNNMNSSIAADVQPIDLDNDGYIDYLFAVDIKGQVWRFDFAAEFKNSISFVSGGRLATLGGKEAADYRRFYNKPDIAFFRPRGEAAYFTITISSGYRAHPKDESVQTDAVFVLFNNIAITTNTSNKPLYGDSGGNPITIGDLYQIPITPDPVYANKTDNAYGWYYSFKGSAEKGLSKATTYNEVMLLSTYLPVGRPLACTDTGSGRLYAFNIKTGAPEFPSVSGGSGKKYFVELQHGGIPPDPVIIFTREKDSTTGTTEIVPIICVGTECLTDDSGPLGYAKLTSEIFWRENPWCWDHTKNSNLHSSLCSP